MSRRPFYKRYPGDFAMGTRDLSLEERGAYNDVLDLMYDKGRPIPDEARWIAGFIGISPRKWGTIRESLLAAGKLILRGDRLSNPRFERELELEGKEQAAAVTWGSMGGKKRAAAEKAARIAAAALREPEFELSQNPPRNEAEKGPKIEPENQQKSAQNELSEHFQSISSAFSEDFHGQKSGEPEQISNNINGASQGPLKPARASIFQSPEKESYDSFGKGAFPNPPKPKRKAKSKPKAASARKMPKGWQPSPLTPEAARIAEPWPSGMLERELARFRDHAEMNGRTCKSWDAAWRMWIRKADDDWQKSQARSGGKPSGWLPSRNR